MQSLGIAFYLESATKAQGGLPLVYSPGWAFRFMTVLTLTTGSVFVMWLGEQITERGIGNGMSLVIYAGIVVGLPRGAVTTLKQLETGEMGPIGLDPAPRPDGGRRRRDRLRRTGRRGA